MAQARERLPWIDGLRGLACLAIFAHHFAGCFYPVLLYGSDQGGATPAGIALAQSPLAVLVNGNFWVCVFFVVGGFVAAWGRFGAEGGGSPLLRQLPRQLLHRYLLAEKMIEKLLEGKKTEISEEESRAVDFQVIRVKDKSLSDNIAERISNGESFLTLASLYSENTRISYSAARGELTEELEEAVFSMKENEISPVIASGENYYIVRMVNTRNTLLSINEQENRLARKRYEAWKSVYSSLVSEGLIKRNEEVWQSIRLKCDGEFNYHSLFDFFAQ